MCHGCKPGLLSSERLPLRRGAVDRDRRGPWSPAKRTRWSGAGAPCDVQLFRNKASLIAMKCEIGTLWETCRDNGPRTAMHAVQLGSIARHNTVCLLHPYCIVFKMGSTGTSGGQSRVTRVANLAPGGPLRGSPPLLGKHYWATPVTAWWVLAWSFATLKGERARERHRHRLSPTIIIDPESQDQDFSQHNLEDYPPIISARAIRERLHARQK